MNRTERAKVCGVLLAACATAQSQGANLTPATVPNRLNPAVAAVLGTNPQCAAPYTIRINEVSFNPGPGNAQWVELYNYGTNSVLLGGLVLTDGDGTSYQIPSAVGDLPAGGFAVVYFDGQGPGADDTDASDGLAVLHSTTPGSPFELVDEAALYSSPNFGTDTIRSFVAWGDVPDAADANHAVAAGLWSEGEFAAPNMSGPGLNVSADDDESVGLFDDSDPASVESWVVYRPDLSTPGAANQHLAPELRSPPPDQTTDSGDILFAWSDVDDATGYELTVDDDADFSSPVISVTVSETLYEASPPLADGTYLFRVRAMLSGGGASAYSEVSAITVENLGGGRGFDRGCAGGEIACSVLPDFPLLLQHKDTRMLCLEHCGNSASVVPWDNEHAMCSFPGRAKCNDHDNMYCARASVAMVNNFHNGTLSQDRIGYEYYAPDLPGPDNDLRHGFGMFPTRMAHDIAGPFCTVIHPGPVFGKDIFEWAMGGAGANIQKANVKPPFAVIRNTIDGVAGVNPRTALVIGEQHGCVPNQHATVIIGYKVTAGNREWIRVADPWTGRAKWFEYGPYRINEYVYAQNPANPRMQEAGVTLDNDLDGIVNFDETQRFNTNPNVVDSDGDGVNDKQEVFSYTFRFPWPNWRGIIHRDGDGVRPEMDADSDNGGLRDGQEDKNGNGVWNRPPETDVYNFWDDGPNKLDFVFCIDVTGSMLDDIQAVRAAALNIVNNINTKMPGWRIALVVYRDFPVLPFGQPGDFPFAVVLPFSSNINQVVNAINLLPGLVCCGGDRPESVYYALSQTLPGATIGGWRGGAVKRVVMVFGDAPPHDPEPFSGLRRDDIVRLAQTHRVGGLLRDGETGGGSSGSEASLDFYNVVIGNAPDAIAAFTDLADATGGEVFVAPGSGDVVPAIDDVVDEVDADPIADGGGPYSAQPGVQITLDASSSADEDCIDTYEWDLDGDGLFDVTTSEPTLTTTFVQSGCVDMGLRVTDSTGNATEDFVQILIELEPVPLDCDSDGLLDNCQSDCNENGTPDNCDIAGGSATDCDGNLVPDLCQPDCDGNGTPDVCDIASDATADCNLNTIPDTCDITTGMSQDCNGNGVPDECDPVTAFLGDMNCSCSVNVVDIAPFVMAITHPDDYIAAFPTCWIMRADFNGDGVVSVSDIAGMVHRLTNP